MIHHLVLSILIAHPAAKTEAIVQPDHSHFIDGYGVPVVDTCPMLFSDPSKSCRKDHGGGGVGDDEDNEDDD